MKFPLVVGHCFGPNTSDATHHDGEFWVDSHNLRQWQRRYMLYFDRDMPVTGRFDGPTQRAATAVQRHNNLNLTGVLDCDTWNALWATQRPVEGEPVPGAATVNVAVLEAVQPDWFGRNLKAGMSGPQVAKVRSLLGLEPGDSFDDELVKRVKGFQKVCGLTASGTVDLDTAKFLDARAPTP